MNSRARKKIAKSNDDAPVALVARGGEIDTMLSRIQSLSDDHFGVAPDELTWSDLGTLEYYAELLRRITDMAFNEGEHAA